MLRIFYGKNHAEGQRPTYQPTGCKQGGCAVGFLARENHGTKTKIYIAKSGMDIGKENVAKLSKSLSIRAQKVCRTYIGIIYQKVAADTYAMLGYEHFYVPKHRLAVMDVVNEYSQKKYHVLAQAIMNYLNEGYEIPLKQSLHLMCRMIDGFQVLASLEQCYLDENDETAKSFMECLHERKLPAFAVVEGTRLPILGLLEVMAVSRLLADTDVLGGGAKSAGYVVERADIDGHLVPVAVRIVKIDPGDAFNFNGPDNQFYQSFNARYEGPMKDKKDLQFGNNANVTIGWDYLSEVQQHHFLHTMKTCYALLKDKKLLQFLVERRGMFDKEINGQWKLLTECIAKDKIDSWVKYMDLQMREDVYGELLAKDDGHIPNVRRTQVKFGPKSIGAVCCSPFEVHQSMVYAFP